VLVQQVTESNGAVLTHVFNTGDHPAERSISGWDATITVAPHESQLLTVK
jgi:hypothetical protein